MTEQEQPKIKCVCGCPNHCGCTCTECDGCTDCECPKCMDLDQARGNN